jgi:VIT1/CCC1 family predicted Fe2+/Mn2+ transporter
MGSNVLALIFAAGLGALAYRYIGNHMGYGNVKQVWLTTGAVFIVGYVIFLMAFVFLVHL